MAMNFKRVPWLSKSLSRGHVTNIPRKGDGIIYNTQVQHRCARNTCMHEKSGPASEISRAAENFRSHWTSTYFQSHSFSLLFHCLSSSGTRLVYGMYIIWLTWVFDLEVWPSFFGHDHEFQGTYFIYFFFLTFLYMKKLNFQ